MQTIDQSLFQLFREGLVGLRDALTAASRPEDLRIAIQTSGDGYELGRRFSDSLRAPPARFARQSFTLIHGRRIAAPGCARFRSAQGVHDSAAPLGSLGDPRAARAGLGRASAVGGPLRRRGSPGVPRRWHGARPVARSPDHRRLRPHDRRPPVRDQGGPRRMGGRDLDPGRALRHDRHPQGRAVIRDHDPPRRGLPPRTLASPTSRSPTRSRPTSPVATSP